MSKKAAKSGEPAPDMKKYTGIGDCF